MSANGRQDYGPAGCADGCASRGVQLLVLTGLLITVLRRKHSPKA